MKIFIKKVTAIQQPWIKEVFQSWGAEFIVSRGRKMYPEMLDGFIAENESGEKVGLVTYEVVDNQCEIVTLDAFRKFQGIGTALLDTVIQTMKEKSVTRLWLITMNDNLDAQRFYYRRGWTIAAVHKNAMEQSRQIKPAIPKIGQHAIPLRDEIEFEYFLK